MLRISFHMLFSTMAALSLSVFGCGERGPTPAPPAADAESAPDPSDPSAPQPAQATADEPEESEASPDVDIQVDAGRQRVLLLAPGGPVLVDLWLTHDGRPHTQAIEDLVARVLAAGDTDGDGHSTWKEFTTNTPFLLGPLAGLTSDNLRAALPWTERFDTHTDGEIDPDEARAWLGRRGGRRAVPLTLRSYRSRSTSPRSQSRVWRLLDADRDGRLSSDELDQAPSQLLSRDADDNHVIHLDDLGTLRDQIRSVDANSMPTRQDAGRHAAIMLDDHNDWYRVWYIVSDRYAARGELSPSSFPLFPTLFAELDTDGDGDLTEEEFMVLATRKPHLALRVAFGTSTTEGKYGPSVELLEQSSDLEPAIARSPRRVVLALGGGQLDISVHDMAPSGNFEAFAAARLASLDKDGDGTLNEEELKAETPPGTASFATLDTDGSSTVTAAELADSLRLTQAIVRSQISLMVHNLGDSVFGLLDTDHDGRLGEREIAAAPDRLRSLDGDGDAGLSDGEVPRQLTVALIRGEGPNVRTFNAPTSVPPAPAGASLPGWFVRGDFNRDGEISRREFLGSLNQFRSLDGDGNGYIDAREAASTEGD